MRRVATNSINNEDTTGGVLVGGIPSVRNDLVVDVTDRVSVNKQEKAQFVAMSDRIVYKQSRFESLAENGK